MRKKAKEGTPKHKRKLEKEVPFARPGEERGHSTASENCKPINDIFHEKKKGKQKHQYKERKKLS